MSAGRPKATCWCHSRAASQGTDKVRLAPKLCTAPSTCLRVTMIYFYCRRRPSRPHIKHLNSSPSAHTCHYFGKLSQNPVCEHKFTRCFWGSWDCGALFTDTDKRLAKPIDGKITYAVAPECSTWHTVFTNTTAHSPVLWKRHIKYDTQLFLFLPLN